MIITKKLLISIKPKNKGVSDKFSWNFYKVLNKYKDSDIKIYYRKNCEYTDKPLTFNKDTFSFINAIVSTMQFGDDVVGNTLGTILREGKYNEFYLSNYKNTYTDITEDFFYTYLEIGRCLLDGTHNGWLRYDKERFNVNGKTRTCNWCGKYQELHNKKNDEELIYWQ